MAEILVRVVPHSHSTPQTEYLHIGQYDAVDMHDDGWGWTPTELNNPEWRVIRIQGTTVEALLQWIAVAFDGTGRMTNKRKYMLDNTQNGVQAIIDSWVNGQVNIVGTGDKNKLINAIVLK